MKKIGLIIFCCFFFESSFCATTSIIFSDSANAEKEKIEIVSIANSSNEIKKRLEILNQKSPIDLVYNEYVANSIEYYLGKNKKLISRMLTLAPQYFPMFESELDKYDIPLEFKYLAIVESALNPRARSRSGAKGLWQFMYNTGKEYNLEVTSYMDERQDPLKSTIAACQYFEKLYEMFGDWSLVLAAYNGGPGYLRRTIAKTGLYDYWELRPFLRKETRGYVPAFIAVNYAMNYHKEHNIEAEISDITFYQTDTITLKMQMEFDVLSVFICLPKETIEKLNPSMTKEIFPKNTNITLPVDFIMDFIVNEEAIYAFLEAVEKKEILVNESRFVYVVREGDYLGKIAKENGVTLTDIKKWNKLKNDKLKIGKKLVLFVKDDFNLADHKQIKTPVYIVKEGDTLWDIANKYDGISVSELIEHNNLSTNKLKPGEKILLPTS